MTDFRLPLLGTILTLTAVACGTPPTEPEPEPEFELTDSVYYRIELSTDASSDASASDLFDESFDDEGWSTPLANTILGQSGAGGDGTAFAAVELLEITTGIEIRTGNHNQVELYAEAGASMGLIRCGYPAGTAYRVVATLAPATSALPTGNFEAAEGDAGFEISVGVGIYEGQDLTWITGGTGFGITSEETGYAWVWDEFNRFYGEDEEIEAVPFFDGFIGLDATVVSPDMTVGADGCVTLEAVLSSEGDIETRNGGSLRVSGSYSLSIMIET